MNASLSILRTRVIYFFIAAFLPFYLHAETGVTETKITLGQSAAFSGPAAQLGIQLHAGAKVYFDAVNAQDGV